ncbi:MAG: hypothetical protein HY775_02280 [Acidobacteria bacterium]|nr:hypothetical protein [Acidobacteriota bacterium]
MRTVAMNEAGRLTLPEFEIEVDRERDALILRPALVLRREDAWAYTPEHRGLLARAHADSRAGRVKRRTEGQLAKLAKG